MMKSLNSILYLVNFVCFGMFCVSNLYGKDHDVHHDDLKGLYHVISSTVSVDGYGFSRSMGIGKLFLDSKNNKFFYEVRNTDMSLYESCSLNEDKKCKVNFFRSIEKNDKTIDGYYKIYEEGKIVFNIESDESGKFDEIEGFYSQDGSIVFIPFNFDNSLNFSISLKSHREKLYEYIIGDYLLSKISDIYPKKIISSGGMWDNFRVNISNGYLNLSGNNFFLNENKSSMQQSVFCQDDAENCVLSAKLGFGEDVKNRYGGYHVGRNGIIEFHSNIGDNKLKGFYNKNKTLIVGLERDRHGELGLSFFTKKGQNMVNSNFIGSYFVYTQEQFFNEEGDVLITNPTGRIVFDGENKWIFNGKLSGVLRENCDVRKFSISKELNCLGTTISLVGPFMAGAEGEYLVNPDGSIIMIGVDTGGGRVEFEGNLSADGKIFSLRRVADSVPCVIGCSGFESARSLVIGIR